MLKNPLLILFSCLYHIHIIKQSTFSSSFVRTLFLYIFLLLLFWCGQLFYHKVVLSSLQIILSQTVNYSNTNSFLIFFYSSHIFLCDFALCVCFFFEKAIYKNIIICACVQRSREDEKIYDFSTAKSQLNKWISSHCRCEKK